MTVNTISPATPPATMATISVWPKAGDGSIGATHSSLSDELPASSEQLLSTALNCSLIRTKGDFCCHEYSEQNIRLVSCCELVSIRPRKTAAPLTFLLHSAGPNTCKSLSSNVQLHSVLTTLCSSSRNSLAISVL